MPSIHRRNCAEPLSIWNRVVRPTWSPGHAAACCKIQLDSRPNDEVMKKITARTSEIIFADLVELRA